MSTNLEVQDLSIGYFRKNEEPLVIANKLNFNWHSGECIAVVGINGIGKSTLLRTLGGIQKKLSGSIRIHGVDLESISGPKLATKLSLVLTDPLASKNLTVQELIGLGRQPYTNWLGLLTEDDKKVIDQVLDEMDLREVSHKKCYELSDGQLQKVLIARALAQDTAIMILDEPTTHLDLYHKVQVLKTMKRIAHEFNKTVVYSTHEIDLAIQLCDKLLILDHPSCHFGTATELIENKSFQKLFPSDLIDFDAKSASFKIKN